MKPRIFGAFLIGGALVFGAYVLSDFGHSDPIIAAGDSALEVVAGAAPTRSYISTQDQNADGIPDWQEALRTTDPLILTELASSTFELPDTVTDQFAVEFFERYMRAKGYGPAGVSNDEIIETSVNNLTSLDPPAFLTLADITLSNEYTSDTIFAYGNSVGEILQKYTTDTNDTEAEVLLDIVRSGDRSRMTELEAMAANYQKVIADLQALPTPTIIGELHLDLINSLVAIHEDIEVFLQVYEDPMRTLLYAQRYESDVFGLVASLENIIVTIVNTGSYYPDQSHPGFFLMAFHPLPE